MLSAGFRRQVVALTAAYALAMQTLLLSFAPAEVTLASVPSMELCSQADSAGGDQPTSHDMPCLVLCTAMAQGVGGLLPPQFDVVAAVLHSIAALAPVAEWALPWSDFSGPQSPRGPPLG